MDAVKTSPITLTKRSHTIVDQLIDLLRERILSGEIKPGDKLSETMLAKEFGVSRAPVREVLITLEEQNLIKKTYLGREVVKFSKEEFKELFELKTALESYAVRLAQTHSNESQKEPFLQIIDTMKKNINPLNFKAFQIAGHQFHDCLVNLCGNKHLIKEYESVVKKIRWLTSLSLQLPARPKENIKEHEAILTAFFNGEAVHLLIEEHSLQAMQRTLDQLNERE